MQCLKCGKDFNDLYHCPVCSEVSRKSGRYSRTIIGIEDFLIAFFLGLMVIMVLLQVLMRNLFQSGVMGGDDLIRHLVLWIAFFGAGIATRSNSHVRIDILTHLVTGRIKEYKDIITNLFSTIICIILMIASCQFVFIEYESQAHSQFLDLPVWVLEIVMPVGYLIIAIRFAHNCLAGLLNITRNNRTGENIN